MLPSCICHKRFTKFLIKASLNRIFLVTKMSRKYVHIFLTIISTENTCQIFFDVLSDHAKALVDK